MLREVRELLVLRSMVGVGVGRRPALRRADTTDSPKPGGGGVDVVPALRTASQRLRSSPRRTAMDEAIEAIHGRVAPGAVGGLSQAAGDGDLSVAAEGGGVAVALGSLERRR